MRDPTREVWRIERAGSLDRLQRQRDALPEPGAGEARVRVHAVGLNFADVFACLGLYSATPSGPFVPGLEFAGVVEVVGPPRRDSATSGAPVVGPGDEVMGVTRFGAYATALNVDVRLLRRRPEGWDFAEAAAYPVQGMTAWYGLVELGSVEAGDVVLLHSAAGGVGLLALAILGAIGARVVATVGRHAKREFLVAQRGLSRDQVIVRDRRRFGIQLDEALAAAGADGFDVVFDAVAGPFLLPAFSRLRPEGRLVVYGAAHFMPPRSRASDLRHAGLLIDYLRRPRLDPIAMVSQNRSVMAFNLIWLWGRIHRMSGAYAALDALITAPPLVGRRFPFAEAPAALRHLQSGESIGKVVLDV